MSKRSIVLINGSPRRNGTSYSFARTLEILAEEDENTATVIHAIDYFDRKASLYHLKSIISQSDFIGLVMPMYADTLPYITIWFLEQLSLGFKNELRDKSLFSIVQCGFPEVALCQPAIKSAGFFAEDMGMNWLGGLGVGFGAFINGTLLENYGSRGRKITSAFKHLLQDVFSGNKVSTTVQNLLTPRVPKFLYRPIAFFYNEKIKREAIKKYGIRNLDRHVYLE